MLFFLKLQGSTLEAMNGIHSSQQPFKSLQNSCIIYRLFNFCLERERKAI